MLALPQFDTYHILKAYAEAPDSVRLRAGLLYLKQATQVGVLWQLFVSMSPGMDICNIMTARFGAEETTQDKGADRLFHGDASLSQEERDDIYMKLCGQVGIRVTQEDLDRMRNQTKTNK